MPLRVVRDGETIRLVIGRTFSPREVEELRAHVRALDATASAEIDFSGTAELHPVALAALAELASEAVAAVRTRGLGAGHRRLLAYLGSRAPARED